MKPSHFFLLLITFCFSCEKDDVKAGENVEIYLLKSYQSVTGRCQVDASSALLQDTALIENQDIIEYSRNDYEFKLTNAAIQRIKGLEDKTPFAVAVDKQVVYYGFFKPGFSSSSCDNSITMDVKWSAGNKISLRLGYPAPLQRSSINDQRNDSRITQALKNQGKLK